MSSEREVNKPRIKMATIDASIREFSARQESMGGRAFQIASLLVYFSKKSIEQSYKNISGDPLPEQEWESLRKKSVELRQHTKVAGKPVKDLPSKWILEDGARNEILKQFTSIDHIRKLLDKLVVEYNNYFQLVYTSYLIGKPKVLDELTLDELVATHSICKWAAESRITVPNEEMVLMLLRQKEFIQPFERLTRNFKGRITELNRLDKYFRDSFSRTESIKKILGFKRNSADYKPILVSGIGGVGKSTLVAKFILNNQYTPNGQRIPLIYLDFDRPGLSVTEPMHLVKYALQQLGFQFPSTKAIFDSIANEIDEKFETGGADSRSTDHLLVLDRYIQEFNNSPFSDLPILMVFDSFEEIQYRASRSQLNNFFNFLRSLSSSIKGLLPIFVGRSELEKMAMEFETLLLPDFDKASAIAYLGSLDIRDESLAAFIFDRFKGNPLKLQLIADLLKKDEVVTVEGFNKKYSSDNTKIDEAFNLQFLVQRNLDHTHDDRVRAIAIPGLLIRTINPEIIQQVLAGPCGLGDISLAEASEIYEALEKESFLITATNNGISFRMDLRIELYDHIINMEPEKTSELRRKAIEYYKGKTTPEDQAEYLYHRLKNGDDPIVITTLYQDSMRPYLETSLKEFDIDAYTYLASSLNIPMNTAELAKASLPAWEYYYITLIKEALETGDETTLLDISNGLLSRNTRSEKKVLDYYEAKLFERLGNKVKFRDLCVDGLLNHSKEIIRQFPFRLLMSKYHEWENNFDRALSVLMDIKTELLEGHKKFAYLSPLYGRFYIDANFTVIRLLGRLEKKESVQPYRNAILDILTKWKSADGDDKSRIKSVQDLLPFPYKVFYNRAYPLESFVESVSKSYYAAKVFEGVLSGFNASLRDKADLEQMINKRYGLRLKDVCEPGVFEVNKMDIVKFMEIDKDRTLFHDGQKKCIIICCDGIWEQESLFENGTAIKTNVEKFFKLLSDRSPDGLVQLKMYDKGRGKSFSWLSRIIGIFDGKEIDFIIKDMYSFIALNYSVGDDIFLFGFSKGAYIARCLSGLINHCGLLKHDSIYKVDEAYEMYRNRQTYLPGYNQSLELFKKEFCYEKNTPVKMVGVWETVGKLGIPRNMALFRKQRYEFWNTDLPENVQCAFHALAVDEKRTAYSPCYWTVPKVDPYISRGVKLEQTWFPGVHRNIGGGYSDTGLSDITLEWMIEKARYVGLSFDEAFVKADVHPNVLGPVRSPIESFLSFARQPRKIVMDDDTMQSIHESVLLKMKQDERYRPKSIDSMRPGKFRDHERSDEVEA